MALSSPLTFFTFILSVFRIPVIKTKVRKVRLIYREFSQSDLWTPRARPLKALDFLMSTGIIVPLEAQYFWKPQREIGVEIKFVSKLFILHLPLSSCFLAEKGSILC